MSQRLCFRRFHGEEQGMTEDTFLSATLRLSAECRGGIDAQLSDVSSDKSFSDEEDEGIGGVIKMRSKTVNGQVQSYFDTICLSFNENSPSHFVVPSPRAPGRVSFLSLMRPFLICWEFA